MKYRKKPVVIEAMQFDGTLESAEKICKWANAYVDHKKLEDSVVTYVVLDNKPYDLMVDTLEGPLNVSKSDWVIKGIKGEFYPCKPDIFEQTYELVTPKNK